MRQQQMEMQRQQQALQLQQMQRQAQQQDTDTNALRGLFQPLPGPTQDGSQLRKGFDPAGMLQAGASPQALQQAMQLDQMVNPRAKPAEFKEVGGHLVRIGGDGQVAPAWSPPAKPQEEPTAVREYQFAQQQGYPGTFSEWEHSRRRAGASQVNVDRAPQGYMWQGPGKLAPIPGGPADKLPEKQQGQVVGVQNLRDAISEYRSQLAGHSKLDVVSPGARAEMGTKYQNMMLQAKEAYNLGVLNGPDMAVLQSVITDPMSINGLMTPRRSLDRQAAELDRIMTKIAGVASQVRPRGATPGAEPAAAPGKVVNFGDLK